MLASMHTRNKNMAFDSLETSQCDQDHPKHTPTLLQRKYCNAGNTGGSGITGITGGTGKGQIPCKPVSKATPQLQHVVMHHPQVKFEPSYCHRL